MVPGSTFRYGSNFIRLTLMHQHSSRQPMEAAASPLPSEDTTPPVTKMYFADIVSSPQLCLEICAGWCAQSIMTEKVCVATWKKLQETPSSARRPPTVYSYSASLQEITSAIVNGDQHV